MINSPQSFLRTLTNKELNIFLRNGQKECHVKNTLIIREGDRSSCAYIINSGKVKIFLSDKHGKEIILGELKSSEYFGEMALIDKEVRSAAVMTMEDTELTVISQENFRKSLQAYPEIAERIMLGLVTNLREANKKISSLVFTDAYERVANMLLVLAKTQHGLLVIDDKPTHQHMANVVGASREMITRILKNMAADGFIKIAGKQIIVLKRPRTSLSKES